MLRRSDQALQRDCCRGRSKPLISLTVKPESSGTDVLGKSVGELQSGVGIINGSIYGRLKHVDGYTGFSGNPEEQSGHYLVLKMETPSPDDVITVELIGGTVGHPVTLDEDRNIVLRITNPHTQAIEVVATDGNTTATKRYTLESLKLE